MQQMNVRRGQQAVREAEKKLAMIQRWDRELDHHTDPFVRQINHLHGFLTADLGRAAASLDQTIKTLENYAAIAPGGTAPTAQPAEPDASSHAAPENPAPAASP